MIGGRISLDATGSAFLLALIALSLFSLLALFLSLTATTGVQVSDNFESQMQATYAALAGLNHTRALLRGLSLNDLLRGPDGQWDSGKTYMAAAASFGFRNPVPLSVAQMLDVFDPSPDVSSISDDGILSTGAFGGSQGTVLIPKTGIAQTAPNPYGAGAIVTSRYFVKVSDNNGEASETAKDPANSPFTDGDGIIIVRSLGVAKSLTDIPGATLRRNSVAVFEARFKRPRTWDLPGALVVLGPDCRAVFSGTYEISGGQVAGVGTIDTVPGDAASPDQAVRNAAGTDGSVTGGNEAPPSIKDITATALSDSDQRHLLNPGYLWEFVHGKAPAIADHFYDGSQSWFAGSVPDLGSYDTALPLNAPGQDPKITVVHGDLQISGSVSGGGLLIVTGNLTYTGPFAFNGMVLVVGSGSLIASGAGSVIEGGMLISRLTNDSGSAVFEAPSFSMSGGSRIVANKDNVRMAVGLIPATQISFREIAGSDP